MTLLMSALAIAAWCAPVAIPHLQYDRSAIAAGEWWRIVTCHWTHFSLDHLLWDVAAFTLLGALCEFRNRRTFLTCSAFSAVLIPGAIWILLPQMQTYRGLSGIGSAVFTLLAVDLLFSQNRTATRWHVTAGVIVVLTLFVAKIMVEIASSRTIFVRSTMGMVPVPLAHAVGAVTGAICATLSNLNPSHTITGVRRFPGKFRRRAATSR